MQPELNATGPAASSCAYTSILEMSQIDEVRHIRSQPCRYGLSASGQRDLDINQQSVNTCSYLEDAVKGGDDPRSSVG